jgi:hypothetical protein
MLDIVQVLAYNLGLGTLCLGYEFEDAVELEIVVEAGEDFDAPDGAVAVVVAVFQGSAEPELVCSREGEE